MNDEALIREQIEYYRQRAAEYDETSAPPGDPLAAYGRRIEEALDDFRPTGNVLEIASGTGTWTRNLLKNAAAVVALDASPEMHEQARRKLGGDGRVRYVEADVLSWQPEDHYDVVFFSNWLSHVPPGRFDDFWATVRAAIAPQGRVFFVDELKDAWRNEEHLSEEFVHDPSVPIVRRPLLDGRTFNVVKVFWDENDLKERLSSLGWDITVQTVGPFFWGQGRIGENV
jgi:SAM-dependent methyltransferase